MTAKLVYTDRAGNKLYVRYIKTRGTVQWTAKNAEGKLVTSSGMRTLMQRAIREKGKEVWGKEKAEHLKKVIAGLPRAKKTATKSGHRIQRVKVR